MAEAYMSSTATFEHEADEARADAGPTVVSLHRQSRDEAEYTMQEEVRGDLRVLIVLCAASAALSLAALYFIAKGLASI